jgi:hypothetical protein
MPGKPVKYWVVPAGLQGDGTYRAVEVILVHEWIGWKLAKVRCGPLSGGQRATPWSRNPAEMGRPLLSEYQQRLHSPCTGPCSRSFFHLGGSLVVTSGYGGGDYIDVAGAPPVRPGHRGSPVCPDPPRPDSSKFCNPRWLPKEKSGLRTYNFCSNMPGQKQPRWPVFLSRPPSVVPQGLQRCPAIDQAPGPRAPRTQAKIVVLSTTKPAGRPPPKYISCSNPSSRGCQSRNAMLVGRRTSRWQPGGNPNCEGENLPRIFPASVADWTGRRAGDVYKKRAPVRREAPLSGRILEKRACILQLRIQALLWLAGPVGNAPGRPRPLSNQKVAVDVSPAVHGTVAMELNIKRGP